MKMAKSSQPGQTRKAPRRQLLAQTLTAPRNDFPRLAQRAKRSTKKQTKPKRKAVPKLTQRAKRCNKQEAKDYRCQRLNVKLHMKASCPKCKHQLSMDDVSKGWTSSETDVTTACPKCRHRFVASLVPHYTGSNKYESVPFWCPTQTKACFRFQWNKSPPVVFTLSAIIASHPTLYWNLFRIYKTNGKTMDEVFNEMCLRMCRQHIRRNQRYTEPNQVDADREADRVDGSAERPKSGRLPRHFVALDDNLVYPSDSDSNGDTDDHDSDIENHDSNYDSDSDREEAVREAGDRQDDDNLKSDENDPQDEIIVDGAKKQNIPDTVLVSTKMNAKRKRKRSHSPPATTNQLVESLDVKKIK
jgi:hypothetical protein